ncbi:MAG TPA: HAD hydrolase-like protein, partial [bacterium]|nr:HAD hydrolase-like protein [bacterium]
MIKIEVMFFDLDGTLVDSLDDIGASVNHTLTTLGYSALPKEKLRRFVGDGMQTLLARALSEFEKPDNDQLMTAVSIYRTHHDEHCLDFVRTYDGVLDVLTHFNH